MTRVDATDFRNDIFGIPEQTIGCNKPVKIGTEEGNAVLLSEEDHNGLIEILHLSSIPGMEEKIVEGIDTPIEDCIPEDDVER